MPTRNRKISVRIAHLKRQLYILNFLIDNGASTCKTLLENRPGRIPIRPTLRELRQLGYVQIEQEPIITPNGDVVTTLLTYEVSHYPRALRKIKQCEQQLNEYERMAAHG